MWSGSGQMTVKKLKEGCHRSLVQSSKLPSGAELRLEDLACCSLYLDLLRPLDSSQSYFTSLFNIDA